MALFTSLPEDIVSGQAGHADLHNNANKALNLLKDLPSATDLQTSITNSKNRANHTGTQLAATISDLNTSIDSRTKYNSIVTKTASYTATATDYTILASATTAALTITMPAATLGKMYVIKKVDSSSNAVTINTTSSQTIDGALTQVLNIQYSALTLHSDGTNWFVI